MLLEPLISIGVPVYNDAPWLRNALDHILEQEYKNLDIIIADDGSKDGSREICREYATRDPRIRYFENKHNLGGWGNHIFVFDVSQGDYFAWGSGHDYYEPYFISRMYQMLMDNPSVVQCCAKLLQSVDGAPYIPPGIIDSRGLRPVERIKKLMDFRLAGGSMDIFFGLYRSEYLAKATIPDSVSADEILLAELSFMGELMQVDEVMAHKIYNRGEKNVRANRAAYRAHLDSYKSSKGTLFKEYLPRLYSFIEYMNMLDRVGLSFEDREILFNEIKDVLIPNYEKVISEEMEYFVEHFTDEIPSLAKYPLLQRVMSAQVLGILNMAAVLGIEKSEKEQLYEICQVALGLGSGSGSLTRRPLIRKIDIWKTARKYFRTFADTVHSIVGDGIWRVLPHLFSWHTLIILWIMAMIFLYSLLFNPDF